MKTIEAITVQIKVSDGHEDQYVLVHDGTKVIELAEPAPAPGRRGTVGTHSRNTMVVGTKAEIEAEITRLNLTPKPQRASALRRAAIAAEHAERSAR
jgi:hypothetical protein